MTTTMTMDTMMTGDSDGGGCPHLLQSMARIDRVMGDATYNQRHQIKQGGDENITIKHGCGGGDCGGGSNSGGDAGGNGGGGDNGSNGGDGGNGGNGGNGRGRESDSGIGCGRADDDGSYGGGKSDNVTTVRGTVAMGLAVAVVAKATMMTLYQCTRVKRSTTQVAVAVMTVDGEDGMQWWRWGGHSMAKSVAR